MKYLGISLLIFAIGCTTGIKFNPDWHVGDYEQMRIVPEKGEPILCEDPRFNNYACMHVDKIKELKEILLKARMPKSTKRMIIKKLEL